MTNRAGSKPGLTLASRYEKISDKNNAYSRNLIEFHRPKNNGYSKS
jgi:hypothetical protein